MQIKAGFTLTYESPFPTPMLLCLHLHPSRRGDLLSEETLVFSPHVEAWEYQDGFGNACTRITAPAGALSISTEIMVFDAGLPDVVPHDAHQHEIADLPDDTLVFLLGSRYCETDQLTEIAWKLFGSTLPGWPRVQAILDFVHNHLRFDYQQADRTRTAFGGYMPGTPGPIHRRRSPRSPLPSRSGVGPIQCWWTKAAASSQGMVGYLQPGSSGLWMSR